MGWYLTYGTPTSDLNVPSPLRSSGCVCMLLFWSNQNCKTQLQKARPAGSHTFENYPPITLKSNHNHYINKGLNMAQMYDFFLQINQLQISMFCHMYVLNELVCCMVAMMLIIHHIVLHLGGFPSSLPHIQFLLLMNTLYLYIYLYWICLCCSIIFIS